MQYAINAKGKVVAILEGHIFYRAKQTKTTMQWECIMYGRNRSCKARLTTLAGSEGRLLRATTKHTHEPPRYKLSDISNAQLSIITNAATTPAI